MTPPPNDTDKNHAAYCEKDFCKHGDIDCPVILRNVGSVVDKPEYSCLLIDGIIKKYPDTANTLEIIRKINTQLRYNSDAEKIFRVELAARLEKAESLLNKCEYAISFAGEGKLQEEIDKYFAEVETFDLKIKKP